VQALRFPFTLEVKPTARNGLLTPSIALVFQVRAIDRKRLLRKVGDLEGSKSKEIDGMLKRLLKL